VPVIISLIVYHYFVASSVFTLYSVRGKYRLANTGIFPGLLFPSSLADFPAHVGTSRLPPQEHPPDSVAAERSPGRLDYLQKRWWRQVALVLASDAPWPLESLAPRVGSPKCSFKRSTETTSIVSPICTLKHLGPLCITAKGP
jgi:hypothetical protein